MPSTPRSVGTGSSALQERSSANPAAAEGIRKALGLAAESPRGSGVGGSAPPLAKPPSALGMQQQAVIASGAAARSVGGPTAQAAAALGLSPADLVFCPLPSRKPEKKKASCWREQEYLDQIERLESQLQEAKRTTRELSSKTASDANRRGRLEEFFLLCMHDLRQQAVRQRGVTAAKVAGEAGRAVAARKAREAAGFSSLFRESPFRGNMFYATYGLSGYGGTPRMDSTVQSVQFEKILRVLSESEELHRLLYERLFPHRRSNYHAERSAARANRWGSAGVRASSGSFRATTAETSGTLDAGAVGSTWEATLELASSEAAAIGLALASPKGAPRRLGTAGSGSGGGRLATFAAS